MEIDYDELLSQYAHLLETSLIFDLEMLKLEDEYHFNDMFWNVSLLKVKKNVPYTLMDVSEGMQLEPGYSYYASGQMYDFDGENVTAFYKFFEDQLKMVQLVIISPENLDQMFEDIVHKLSDICGQEGIIAANDMTGQVCYQWNGESTILRLEKTESDITISVGLAEAF